MRKKAKTARVMVTTNPTERLIFKKRLWNKKNSSTFFPAPHPFHEVPSTPKREDLIENPDEEERRGPDPYHTLVDSKTLGYHEGPGD